MKSEGKLDLQKEFVDSLVLGGWQKKIIKKKKSKIEKIEKDEENVTAKNIKNNKEITLYLLLIFRREKKLVVDPTTKALVMQVVEGYWKPHRYLFTDFKQAEKKSADLQLELLKKYNGESLKGKFDFKIIIEELVLEIENKDLNKKFFNF